MGFFINQYQGFSGNAVDMASVATQCAQLIQMPGDLDKINERLVRYYVTEGLVERPKRVGREAEYGYLHLLQFLAGRFLVEAGFPMQKVAPYLNGLGEGQLESLVMNKTKPNMAELLVASFKHGAKQTEGVLNSSISRKVSAQVTPKQDSVMFSMDAMKQRKHDPLSEVSERIDYLEHSIKSAIGELVKEQADLLREGVYEFSRQIDKMQQEMSLERERWHFDMERQREQQRLMLEEQHKNYQELIAALIDAQNKGKENV